MTKFYAPIPILRSFDEESAKAFYIDFLGFELLFEHRFEDQSPLYFGVKRGDCILHLSEHYGDSVPGISVRIDVDDVQTYCVSLNAKQYKFSRPGIQTQSWGYDEMAISDPSGNRIIFCTPLPNTPASKEAGA